MTNCNELLTESIRMYQVVSELYQFMQNRLSNTAVSQVEAAVETINTLLRDAREVDSLIAEQLKSRGSLSESTTELLARRNELLAGLLTINHQLTGKARNVTSLLRHEISSMTKNRNALKGYRPAEADRKSIVRSFC